jgi:hypothetical protein
MVSGAGAALAVAALQKGNRVGHVKYRVYQKIDYGI